MVVWPVQKADSMRAYPPYQRTSPMLWQETPENLPVREVNPEVPISLDPALVELMKRRFCIKAFTRVPMSAGC